MRKYVIPAAAILLFSLFAPSRLFSGSPCRDCTMTREGAALLLENRIANAKVLAVRASPIPCLCEVVLDVEDKKAVLYVDSTGSMVVSGAILDINTGQDLTKQRLRILNPIDTSRIPLEDALVLGEKDAPHRIIVFDDPECPSCEKLYLEMVKIAEARSDIAFFIKMCTFTGTDTPAYIKAKTIACEKSLQLLEDAFGNKELPPPSCETEVIDQNVALARSLGIAGVPAVIFPDGIVVEGASQATKRLQNIAEEKKEIDSPKQSGG